MGRPLPLVVKLPSTAVRRRVEGAESFADHPTLEQDNAAGTRYAVNLRRPVYCVLGIPIDAVDMATTLTRIEAAAKSGAPFLVATPNLNFLVHSRTNHEFRESILDSDLSPADGMSIIWLARLIGLPIREKVSGSDMFEAMKARTRRFGIFFFGGPEGAARAAAEALNSTPTSLYCVGTLYPGFGSVEEMSKTDIIETINASNADFLAVSLGANKGQLWLHRNHQHLTVPVRVHLGAVLNFQAGKVRRAPQRMQQWGFEWLWRIKEEPHLWTRYWNDGCVLLRLLVIRILPLAFLTRWHRLRSGLQSAGLVVQIDRHHDSVTISLCGVATEPHIEKIVSHLQDVLMSKIKLAVIDLSGTRYIDPRFLGTFLILRKELKAQGAKLYFVGASSSIKTLFWLNELSFLLAADSTPDQCRV
jgi:N-acetylglucosaminyldiphosphoundecaprenol N-acetyl-beta-D-mannosaminyltransferase